ncbi:MAG: DUF2231 domain-containing protein [Ktedonobacteraceae bacterium]
MESKVKSMGHPIHPMLVNFPLGLLVTSAVFDIIHIVTGNGYWSGIAYWMIAAGVITGLLAAIVGTNDAVAIPSGTRAKTVSILHGTGNFLILVLFAASWAFRFSVPGNPPVIAYVLSFLGTALLGVTGWLGGELTLRLGIGVDEGANLNAPSSLSGLPASENITDSSKMVDRSIV